MKRILTTAYTNFNIGDDLFLKLLFERYPNSNFILFTQNDNYANLFKNYKNVEVEYFSQNKRIFIRVFNALFFNDLIKIPRLIAFLRAILIFVTYRNKVDAYLEIGGSIFMQKTKKIETKEYFNYYISNFFRNKKLFFLGANFGPVKTPEFLKIYEKTFLNFDDVCFRDKWSASLFSNISSVRCASDIVFSMKLPKIKKQKNTIGFSIIDLSNRTDMKQFKTKYLNSIIDLVNQFPNEIKKVFFFSFCSSEGDMKSINEVVSSLSNKSKKKVRIVSYTGDIFKFLEIYLSVETMFVTRFHAMILSIMASQKIHPFVYSDKMLKVLSDINYDQNYSEISQIENFNTKQVFSELKNYKFNLKEEIINPVNQFLILDSFISGK